MDPFSQISYASRQMNTLGSQSKYQQHTCGQLNIVFIEGSKYNQVNLASISFMNTPYINMYRNCWPYVNTIR